MKFSYTALNRDNQKLTGVLDAEDINIAKDELHKMDLSIISINEISEEEFAEKIKTESAERVKTGIQTFTFEALDPSGKLINGTIDAPDDYSAYKRLLIEYKFKVNALYPPGANEAEITASKTKIAGFDARIEEEGIDLTPASIKGEEFEDEKINMEIVKEIDKFIKSTKKILKEHKNKFSNPFLQEIDKTLNELERIRTSNNINHISEICNQIYELISHPDQAPEDSEATNSSYQNILDSIGDTSLVRGDLSKYKKALGLNKVQSFFGRIIGRLNKNSKPKGFGGIEKVQKKGIFQKIYSQLFKKKKKKKEEISEAPSFSNVVKKFFSYLAAPNPILRKTRKHDLSKTYHEWRESKKKPEKEKEETDIKGKNKIQGSSEEETEAEAETKEGKKPKGKDFTPFFAEMDSFVAWLLFFYIAYFYMVNFSFEKDFGLSREFVIKTLKTPLIINITIFLIFAHLILKLKTQFFRRNFFGSLFLIFFGLGIYILLIVNF